MSYFIFFSVQILLSLSYDNDFDESRTFIAYHAYILNIYIRKRYTYTIYGNEFERIIITQRL